MAVEFEQTATKTEVVTHYSVKGAPVIEHQTRKGRVLSPQVVRFTFQDGEVTNLFVNGKLVKANGDISDRWEQINHLYYWNQTEWPAWLHDLYAFAQEEYREARRAERREIFNGAAVTRAVLGEVAA